VEKASTSGTKEKAVEVNRKSNKSKNLGLGILWYVSLCKEGLQEAVMG
jgi:hypothetical protein